MRKMFPGYFRKSGPEIQSIWKTSLFVFDANVLLNLYRYSPPTANGFIDVIRPLKARLWLPWQAAREFHRNRLGVVNKQTASYGDTATEVKRILANLENPRQHPFVEDRELMNRIDATFRDLITALENKQAERKALLRIDERLDQIGDLFDGRVGAEPEAATRDRWMAEAKTRCEQKIPPGFKDAGKDGDRPYGDALLWLELLEFAKDKGKPIVFVTDDAKSDWWLETGGSTIGPDPMLVQEFLKITNQPFLMYRPDRFVEHASVHVKKELAPGVVAEIREQTEDSRERLRRTRFSSGQSQTFAGNELEEICEHLWRHRGSAEELVRAIGSSPTPWQDIPSPMLIPPAVRRIIDVCTSECPCLARLAPELHDIPENRYQEGLADMGRVVPESHLILLKSVRELPRMAVEAMRIARIHRSGPYDPRNS